jgi:SOS response regulatory protein OraA/RecX
MVEALPVYPDIQVAVRSRNRWAVAAAIRQALRRAGKDRSEIDRFVAEAVAAEDPERLRAVCRRWVRLQLPNGETPAG